jgi:CRISPR/Cas system-associated exonuclease Cas4 (RecB family)
MVRKSQELRPVMTRIPEGLRRRLEREAELNGRSMNAEIIHRLEQSFRQNDTEELLKVVLNRANESAFRALNAERELLERSIKDAMAEIKEAVSNEATMQRALALRGLPKLKKGGSK